MAWVPPGKDCGACGASSCEEFLSLIATGAKSSADCLYHSAGQGRDRIASSYTGRDVLGTRYDFVLHAFPGEPSARKFIVPFRADLVERWNIQPGDLVTGHPAGPGCPVGHD